MHSVPPAATEAPQSHAGGAPRPGSVGDDLRMARERLGWSLSAVAEALRIRPSVLAALEAGRRDDLPAAAYTLSFLRAYARALGLGADDMVRRFRAERTELTRKTELEFPTPVAERSLPLGAVVLLGCVLAIGSYAGWYHFSGSSPTPPPVHEVPERLADMVKPPIVPPAPPVPTVAPVPAAPPPAAADTAAAEPPAALPAPVPPSSAAAAAMPTTAATFAPPAAPVQNAAASVAGSRIVLRATADAWLEVRDHQGHVLLNRVLHAGESWSVPPVAAGASPLLLTTGNAGGTEVAVDGKVIGPLGKDGAVRHDLLLDADAILGGSLQPPPAAVATGKRPPPDLSRR